MDDELILSCGKCCHNVYLTNPTFERVASMAEYSCPACGEEGYGNWVILGVGHLDEEEDHV